MTCYLCERPFGNEPAIPRRLDDGAGPVFLCAECYESCAGCCAPLKVFEPVGTSVGAAMPLMFRDSRAPLNVVVRGLRVNLCGTCESTEGVAAPAGQLAFGH